MLRGVDGTNKDGDEDDDKETKKKKTTEEGEEEVDLENEILLEVLNEGRGEREDRGERDEWKRHVGWHRKENVGTLREQRHQRPRQQQQQHASKDHQEIAVVAAAADDNEKKGWPPQEANMEDNKAGRGERAGSKDAAAAHKLRGKGLNRNRNRDNDDRLPSLVLGGNIEGNRTLNYFHNSNNESPSWPSLSSIFVVTMVFVCFGALWMFRRYVFRRHAPVRQIGYFRRRSTKGRTL